MFTIPIELTTARESKHKTRSFGYRIKWSQGYNRPFRWIKILVITEFQNIEGARKFKSYHVAARWLSLSKYRTEKLHLHYHNMSYSYFGIYETQHKAIMKVYDLVNGKCNNRWQRGSPALWNKVLGLRKI